VQRALIKKKPWGGGKNKPTLLRVSFPIDTSPDQVFGREMASGVRITVPRRHRWLTKVTAPSREKDLKVPNKRGKRATRKIEELKDKFRRKSLS